MIPSSQSRVLRNKLPQYREPNTASQSREQLHYNGNNGSQTRLAMKAESHPVDSGRLHSQQPPDPADQSNVYLNVTSSGQFTMELPEIRQSNEKLQTINELKRKHRASIQSHPSKDNQQSQLRSQNNATTPSQSSMQKVSSSDH